MKRFFLFTAAMLLFQSISAGDFASRTNYALHTNGAGIVGKERAYRAIDGNPSTYWGRDPYPAGFTVKLAHPCEIDGIRILFYKTGTYTFKAEYSLDNVNYFPLASAVVKGVFALNMDKRRMQYVRVTVLHNKANRGVHVCELELYGPKGQKVKKISPLTVSKPVYNPIRGGQRLKPVKITGSSYVKFDHNRANHSPAMTGDGRIGDDRFYWASDFKNKAPIPHWICFDFGKKVTFNAIKLDMVERYNFSVLCNIFKIEYFDGKVWKTLIDQPRYAGRFFSAMNHKDPAVRYQTQIPDAHPVFHFKPVTGTKVRFSTRDSIARLDEMTVLYFKKRPAPPAVIAPKALNDGIVRYSFAPENADFMPGFVRPPLKAQGKVYYVDRGHPDSLRRYFAAGSGDARLSIPVKKPGIYHVFVMGGDQFAPVKGTDLVINGKKFRLAAAPKYHFPREIFTVDAQKSIDILFKGSWLINAVIVVPVEKEKYFEKELTKIIIGKEFHKFQPDPQPTYTRAVKPSAADMKRGFVNFTTPIDQRVFVNTTPKPGQQIKVIRSQSATDALKAVTTSFRFLKNIPDFKVTYSGKLKAALHPVKNWLQRTQHKGSTRKYALVPELLEPNKTVYALKEKTLQYYLIFDIPVGTKPGVYKCRLTVTGKGIPATVIPVEFKVLPFQLERADNKQYAAMYNADIHRPFVNLRSDAALDKLRLEDLRKHNMNSILYPSGRFTTKAEMKKLYLLVNKRLDECGFPRLPMAWHNPHFTVEQVKFIQQMVKETGLREILYYPVDEPHFGRRHIAERLYPLVKSVPGTRSYSTVTEDDIKSFGKYLDFRTYMITGYAKFEPDRIVKDCQRDKAHFYWYSNAGREYPDANRYKAGFFAWRCGGTGQLYWAYDNTADDLWNDFDKGSHDHNAVYFIDNKLCSTLQWEGIREGIDDLRYIYMLEKLVASYPKHPAAKSAKALLARLRKETCVDLNAYQKRFGLHIDVHHYCWWAPEKMEAERNKVIAEIMKFPGKK